MDSQIPNEKTVGQFSCKDGCISGPKQYMVEQGCALIEKIEAGQDLIFNMTSHRSPDFITAILVRLQTDFAGWRGVKSLLTALRSVSNN